MMPTHRYSVSLIQNKLLLVALSSIVALLILLVWLVSPSFGVGLAASLVGALFVAVVGVLGRLPTPPLLWATRDALVPNLRTRMETARKSLFLVGFSFETIFKDYATTLARMLNGNESLEVKILIMHPDSPHVSGHQQFAARPIADNIRATIEGHLKETFDSLTPSAKRRFRVRATHYLPRFAARVFDDSSMLLNFYLYKSRANENPVLELRCDIHRESFECILQSLASLFDHGDDGLSVVPNHKIVENGEWRSIDAT